MPQRVLAGSDPTGNGCVVAGVRTRRQVELLVEAGFTPLDAIRIATSNGARFLGVADRTGTLAPGRQAGVAADDLDPGSRTRSMALPDTMTPSARESRLDTGTESPYVSGTPLI